MAKKPTTTDALAQIQKTIDASQQAQAALQAGIRRESEALDALVKEAAEDDSKKVKQRSKLIETLTKQNTRAHKLTVDLGGGMIGQASTELLNWGVRALGNWSPDGWVAANMDFLQGIPHLVLGLGIYIAEIASRKGGQLPSTRREIISEASKLFAQLGFSNVVRALRVRYGDGKQKDLDIQALQAEKSDLERRLKAALQQPGNK